MVASVKFVITLYYHEFCLHRIKVNFGMVAGTCSGLLSDAGEDGEPISTQDWSPIQHNPEIPPIRNLICEQPFVCQEFVSVLALTA